MPLEDAKYFHDKALCGIDKSNCVCFTNCFGNPWKSGSTSWNPISDCAFDLAVVFIDENRLVFSYLTDED